MVTAAIIKEIAEGKGHLSKGLCQMWRLPTGSILDFLHHHVRSF